ncbi:hypothetical protein [Sphingorhabdus sp.]|uniref:hypothetical protein n=1 Tax=Sphingorhabdus sp. TaxID=1902408 RepID=UPI00391AE8AA
MSRIFWVVVLFVSTVGLSACDPSAQARSPLPRDIIAVIQPFFEAVRRGDQKAAERYVAPSFLKDSKVQFAEMSAILNTAPRLDPVIQQRQGTGAYVTFAGEDGALWISSEVRVVRYGNKPMIEYWDVNAATKPPELVGHVQTMKNLMNYGMIAVAMCALAGLLALIWIIRNRTHLVTSEPVNETRRVAATVRNDES